MRLACQYANECGERFCDAFIKAFDVGDSSPEIQEELETLRATVEERDGQVLQLLDLHKKSAAEVEKLAADNDRLRQMQFNFEPREDRVNNKRSFAFVSEVMALFMILIVSTCLFYALLH